MHNWLQNYQYRSEIAWWIFAADGTWRYGDHTVNGKLSKHKSSVDEPGEEFENGIEVSHWSLVVQAPKVNGLIA